MLAFPSIEHSPSAAYFGVVIFSLATGLCIGYFTRSGKLNSDAIIGIFLVASLAWGILAQEIFSHVRQYEPSGWQTFLFGRMDVSLQFAIVATALLLSKKLRNSVIVSLVVGLVGALGGLAVYFRKEYIFAGPAIVLLLFAQFVVAYALSRFVRAST
jgi:ABC-type Mn2+/Zn2+ transport system permease subunit